MPEQKIDQFIDPELLESNANKVDKENVFYNYSSEEMELLRKEFAQSHIDCQYRVDIGKAVTKALEGDVGLEYIIEDIMEPYIEKAGEVGTKRLKKETSALQKHIEAKGEQRNEKVYIFFHFDLNQAAVYSGRGHLLYTRPMTGEERQGDIFQMNQKTGTDD